SDPRRSDQVRSLREIGPGGTPIATDPRDWARVHAGIVSHAGYQLAIRIGAPRAGAVWYRAISTYLHQFAGFSDMADATLAAAQDLHSGEDEVARAAREAWIQAGVGAVETIGETARP